MTGMTVEGTGGPDWQRREPLRGVRRWLARTRRPVLQVLIGLLAVWGATVPAHAANWILNVTQKGGAVAAGGTVTYEGRVQNDGDTAPPNVLKITIPAGMSYESSTLSNCTVATGAAIVLTCDIPSLSDDQVVIGDITLRTSQQGVFPVTFEVPTTAGGVTDSTPNLVTLNTTVTRGADLSLNVSGPSGPVKPGTSATYTFSAVNSGPDNVTNPIVEVLAPGLSVSSLPSSCTFVSPVYRCEITGTFPPGNLPPLNLTGMIVTAGQLSVQGEIKSTNPPDPIPGNNTDSQITTLEPGSDVAITKERSPAGALAAGTEVTFTLRPRFSGDEPSGLTIVDEIPSNYEIISFPASVDGWSCTRSGQKITCSRASVAGAAGGALGSIAIVAEAKTVGNSVINTAEITAASHPVDLDPNNNVATDGGAAIIAPVIDLAARTAVRGGPAPGGPVAINTPFLFEIRGKNNGPNAFVGTLTLTDTLPAGLRVTNINAATQGWDCGSQTLPLDGPATITCNRTYTSAAPLLPGQSSPAAVLRTVATQSVTLTNSVRVSGSNGPAFNDPTPGNDVASFTVAGTPPTTIALLSVAKTITNPSGAAAEFGAGDPITFRLQLTNAGPNPAANVVLTDLLEGLVNSNAGTPAAGLVSVVSSDPSGFPCTSSVQTGPTPVRLVECSTASLPVCGAGTCPYVDITARYLAFEARTNSAFVSSETADTQLLNNASTVSFKVNPATDLSLTKTPSATTVQRGTEFSYTLQARASVSAAKNVIITDPLPAGLVYVSGTAEGGCSFSSGTVTCSLGDIPLATSKSAIIRVRAKTTDADPLTSPDPVTNEATVSSSTLEATGAEANNKARATVNLTPPSFDLGAVKTDTADPIAVGSETTYNIAVQNVAGGQSVLDDVEIIDTLPPEVDYVSHTNPLNGTCNPPDGNRRIVCTVTEMALGATAAFTVTVRGNRKASATNTVTAGLPLSGDGFDTQKSNNTATQSTEIRSRVDLRATKTASVPDVLVGDDFSFTITLENRIGTDPLTGVTLGEADVVQLEDTLPPGMALTAAPSVSVTAGTASLSYCSGAAGGTAFTCDFGTMSNGAAVSISVPVRVAAISGASQPFDNTATARTGSTDIDATNNSPVARVTVYAPSLSGAFFSDFNGNGILDSGDTGIPGVTVSLTGTLAAGGTLNLITTTGAGGAYSFSPLPPGSYTVSRADYTAPGLTVGAAFPGPAGGSASGAVSIGGVPLTVTTNAPLNNFTMVPAGGISISKAVTSGPTSNPDGTFDVAFTLTVQNPSLEQVNTVEVTDALSGALPGFGASAAGPALSPGQYLVSSAPAGSCGGANAGFDGASSQVVASDFSLAAGGSCTLSFGLKVMPVTPGSTHENSAATTGAGALSGTAFNGTSNVVVVTPTVLSGAIGLVKSEGAFNDADGDGPDAGDTLTYTFTVTNTGTLDLSDVAVSDDKVPAVSCPATSLAPGASFDCTGDYVLTEADFTSGKVDNTATVDGKSPAGDPVSASDSSTTALTQVFDLAIIKTVDKPGPVPVGDTLTYTITATNTGNTTQTDVVVSDPLINPGSTACPSVPANGTCVLTGTYEVTYADADAGKVDNTAQVASAEVPVPETATVTVPVEQTQSLAIEKAVDNAGPVPVGETLTYTITATNTGNTTQTNVVVSDPLITPASITCASVPANGTCVLTGTYAVTATDAQAGNVENTAQALSDQITTPETDSLIVPVMASFEAKNLSKKALVSSVKRGERVPYVITALEVPLKPARIVDIMPPGFSYLEGSGRANGTSIEPKVDGRTLTFDGLVPDSDDDIKLELTLVVTSGAATGNAVNRAQLVNPENGEVLATARATVTIMEEAVFDCSDVIGKVFDDRNRNGYQDDGEPGLPGVRLATVKGLLVTTDRNGRFSIACAGIPDEDIGSNFIVKLDARTLPTGYRVTTENPRKVRLTRGKVVKLNFGASLTRLVSLDLNAQVFEEGSDALKPKWQAGLAQLVAALGEKPSTLRISYAGEGGKLAKARIRAVSREIERRWKEEGRPYRLSIETRIVASGEEAGQ